MRDCVTVPTETNTLPPNKRVQYNFGMVMDVDAFLQEQTHFEWKHALGNRLLHGYGTVCGLEVLSRPDETDVQILVDPGYAVSPKGNWIWVEEQLCALLDAWVQTNRDDNLNFSATGRNRVYVTLCYEECPTDLMPIAGRACATDEDTRAPSRILETARAGFSWEPPEQLAEDAASLFGDILASVTLTDDPVEDESERLLALVAMLGAESSPPDLMPDLPLGSPPAGDEILLWRESVCDSIREALVLWVTEVCPSLQADPGDCILLACVNFQVDIGGRVLPPTVVVDNCERPILIPSRLQQELCCLLGHAQPATPDPEPAPHGHNLDDLGDVNAPNPDNGEVLTWNDAANAWQAEPVEVEAGEADLTRIVALSWFHNSVNVISIVHDGNQETGLAVAFGKNELGDGGMVRANTLNEHVYQVFGERAIGGGLAAPIRFLPRQIVPVDIVSVAGGRITETATSADANVPGVLIIMDPGSFDNNLTDTFRIVLHGDFILDESGERAIDAEHVRAQLPTGDRPNGADRGIQGGRFESWLSIGRGFDEFIDVNSAPANRLARIPGIGQARANAIVANRPYERVNDLTRVPGISIDFLDGIRGLITIG